MKTLFYRIMRFLAFILFKILFFPRIRGKENIISSGRVVFAGNHTKWLDPVLLVTSNRRILHFLAKIELFQGPLKPFIKGMLCIPVNRKVHDGKALVEAEKVLEKDEAICIFPEGTINRTDDVIMPFKMGAVKACQTTNTRLVPFIITGEYKMFKKSIKLEFLKPMKIGKDLEKENQKLMDLVSKKLVEGGKTHGNRKNDRV